MTRTWNGYKFVDHPSASVVSERRNESQFIPDTSEVSVITQDAEPIVMQAITSPSPGETPPTLESIGVVLIKQMSPTEWLAEEKRKSALAADISPVERTHAPGCESVTSALFCGCQAWQKNHAVNK